MEATEQLLGSELYMQLREKAGGAEILIDDGMLIPKHRFDCVNISLKDHKVQVAALKEENDSLKGENGFLRERLSSVQFAEDELNVYLELAKAKLKNPIACRALIDTDKLHGEALAAAVRAALKKLKRTDGYLFYEDTRALYYLTPFAAHDKKTENS